MNRLCCLLSIISLDLILSTSVNETTRGIHILIYENIAEITQPISTSDLPKRFSQQEWNDIRSDSIRLVGNCIDVRAQSIFFNRPSLNGQKILIQRSMNNETYTDGIMIDETRNLVQDLVDNTFYMIPTDRIRYLSIPPIQNYSVDFVVQKYTDDQLYLRYLQSNIQWKVHYDLLLDNNETNSVLQAYADIRNGGSMSLTIDSAELISGDITIQSTFNDVYTMGEYSSDPQQASPVLSDTNIAPLPPTISDAEELAGVYIFRTNETFILNTQSDYILPMFRPNVNIERYGSIEKYFFGVDDQGNAERAYRLRVEETFLPEGKVFIRESDRLVGETYWSDIAANETNEFNLGQDPDLQYIENVELISRRQDSDLSLEVSTYTIDLHLINNKQRSIQFEYRLKFPSKNSLELREGNTTSNLFQIEGQSIIGTFQLDANDEQQFELSFESSENFDQLVN